VRAAFGNNRISRIPVVMQLGNHRSGGGDQERPKLDRKPQVRTPQSAGSGTELSREWGLGRVVLVFMYTHATRWSRTMYSLSSYNSQCSQFSSSLSPPTPNSSSRSSHTSPSRMAPVLGILLDEEDFGCCCDVVCSCTPPASMSSSSSPSDK
jgi:hypothetical protein